MDFSQIYATILFGLILAAIVLHAFVILYRSSFWIVKLWILRYLQCPSVLRRHRLTPQVVRLDLVISALFLAVVTTLNIINVHSKEQAVARTGLLAVVSLVPLYASTQLSFSADLLGVNLKQMRRLHRFLGATAFIEGSIHTVLGTKHISAQDHKGLFGILAVVALGLAFLLPIIHWMAYELFSLLHFCFSMLLASSIWLHVGQSRSKYCMAAAIALLTSSTIFRFARVVFRNMSLSSERASKFTQLAAEVYAEDLIKVDVALPRNWKIRPGQYVYVQLPILTSNSWMQSHPFTIVSWSETQQEGTQSNTTNLELVVKPRRGWTNYVLPALTGPGRANSVTSFVDGPYGGRKDLGEYSTVLMIATGLGIFAHIPYIQGLFDGYERSRIKTRKIKIFWQIENEAATAWAFKWMQKFLDRDDIRDEDGHATFLHISIFVPRSSHENSQPTEKKKFGRRVEMFEQGIEGYKVLQSEILSRDMEREPSVILSVSAEHWLRDGLRKAIAHSKGNDISYLRNVDLWETDFQPEEPSKDFSVV